MIDALAIDTTSDVLSLAAARAGAAPETHYAVTGTAITTTFFAELGRVLARAGLAPEQLGLVVAACGPGSFTGTRIGLAVAKTLAQLAGLPLVGVDTLRLLAAQGEPEEGSTIHALLNCARDEVYHAPFTRREGVLHALAPIALTTFERLPALVGEAPVVLRRFNPAQPGHEEALERLNRAPLAHPAPDGSLLLREGLVIWRRAAGGRLPPVEPIYLKSEAFRKWKP